MCSRLHQKMTGQQGKGSDSTPLVCPHEAPPGVVQQRPVPQTENRYRVVGTGSKEGWNTTLRKDRLWEMDLFS